MKCEPFFPDIASADIIHAATCMSVNAILISNDAHFKAIKEAGLIDVWTISDAIERLLNQG
jgi:predicted nucleic acid-binding protein